MFLDCAKSVSMATRAKAIWRLSLTHFLDSRTDFSLVFAEILFSYR